MLTSALTAACSAQPQPFAPPGQNLPLSPGLQLVRIIGFALTDEPGVPTCTPRGVPRAGTEISAFASLIRDGDAWIATLAPPEAGTLELRIRDAGRRTGGGQGIVGMARGEAPDFTVPGIVVARDVTVSIRGVGNEASAALDGVVYPSSFVTGSLAGTIAFSDSGGGVGVCSGAIWSMRPYSAPD